MFAGDILAAADAHDARRFVAGGISMGAAIALRLAVRHPDRVAALILARPAWVDTAAPENMRPYAEVAALLARMSPSDARRPSRPPRRDGCSPVRPRQISSRCSAFSIVPIPR